jgi:hypothetical protein
MDNPLPEYFLKSVKLPVFNGNDRHYRADEWLQKLEEYFEDAKTVEAHKLRIARQHLKDTAHRWFRNQKFNLDSDFATFKTRYKKRFSKPDDAESALKRIVSLKQTKSVGKYVSEFEALRSRINDMSDFMATQLFINGLKSDISRLINSNGGLENNDLDAVVALAEKLDATPAQERSFIRPQPNQWSRPSPQRFPVQESYPQPMELDAVHGHPNSQSKFQRPPSKDELKKNDLSKGLCFYCHEPDHMIGSCPVRNKKQSNSQAH